MITMNDPNVRWANKTFRLTFMSWDYKATVETTVGGNCSGFDNLSAAVGKVYDELPIDNFSVPYLLLKKDNGDELQNGDDENRNEDWLMDMLVHAEIISIKPEMEA